MGTSKKKRKKRPASIAKAGDREAPTREDAVSASMRRWIGLGLDVVLAVACIVFLVKSAGFAGKARFFTDECFHTYTVERIVAEGQSPDTLAALYSGMPNNTHPLFHWLGAGLYVLGGRGALSYLNVVLCGAMLGLLYWLLRAWVSPTAARIAVPLVLLFDVVHICSQIFYMEMLSAVTFAVAALAVYIAVRGTDWKLYFLAGVACALALLGKQTGYALVPVIVICGLYFLAMRRWRHATGVAVLVGAFAVTFAVGMFALAENPWGRFRAMYVPVERGLVPKPLRLFPSGRLTAVVHDPAGDLQPAGGGVTNSPASANDGVKRAFGYSAGKVFKAWVRVLGPFGLLLTLACIVHLFLARPIGATAPLVLAMVALVAGAIRISTVDARHFVSYVPVLAACAGIAVPDLLGRIRRTGRMATLGATAVAVVAGLIASASVINYRVREPNSKDFGGLGRDVPQALVAAAEAIPQYGSGRGWALSLWTSSTWYYSGFPTTWAGVNVPKLNSVMFNTDPWGAFKPYYRGNIRYFVIDNRGVVPDAQYTGLGYTETFYRNVISMLQAGVMRVIYPQPAVLAAYQAGNPDRPIWGNPEIPFIVIEFDREALIRFTQRAKPAPGPRETPEP